MQFLEFYQAKPILWDPNQRDHKNKLKIHDAWMRISAIMEVTVPELKKKRDSLLSSYRSYKTKVKKSTSSGAASDDVYKPVWFAYALMDSFLGDTTQCNKTINTEAQSSSILNLEEEIEALGESQTENDNNSNAIGTIRRRRNPPELLAAGKVVKEALDTFATTLRRTDVAKQPKELDDCDLYAQLLAKKLRQMPEEKRLKFMHAIDGMFLRSQYEYQPETCYSPTRSSPSPSYYRNQFQRPGTSASSYSEPYTTYAVNYTPKNIKISNSRRRPSTASSSQSLLAPYNSVVIQGTSDNTSIGPNVVIQSDEMIRPPVIHIPDEGEYMEEQIVMTESNNMINTAFSFS